MILNLKKLMEGKLLVISNEPISIADIHSIKRKAVAKTMMFF